MAMKLLAPAGLATAIMLAASASADESVAADASPGADAPHFVVLDEVVVPIVDGDRVTGRLRFRAVIAARDDGGRERLLVDMPRLRSTSLVAGLEFSRLHAAALRPVDARALAGALAAALQPRNPDIDRVLLVSTAAQAG